MYNLFYNLILSFSLFHSNKYSNLLIIDNNKFKSYSSQWLIDIKNDNNDNNHNKIIIYNNIINENSKFNNLISNPFYYYIAYYDRDKLNNHPKYIGGLLLDSQYKNFNLNTVIENPINNDDTLFYKFILELEELCYYCNVSLTIENLKNFSNSKYWYLVNNYF
uniref:Uncharacterized protein n=1 Tax=viral metagenome TaxID=1070528 RepID=A0A6C0AXB7_9ZZZZ|tara:strand:- start:34803 stop:35291 length:489 start_codon:yes stop_codon:yes gene_type:complete